MILKNREHFHGFTSNKQHSIMLKLLLKHIKKMNRYTLKDFVPLIIIFSIIFSITLGHQLFVGWNAIEGMRVMMASFFLIFGFFKVINLSGFAKAYRIYDVIAQRFYWYGYIYPLLEILLGIAYLFMWYPLITNSCTLLLMTISAIGVLKELKKGKVVTCACLGAVFTIPMTYVTLAEDLLMAAMATLMLFMQIIFIFLNNS